MIECEDRVNGEFYVAPIYSYLVQSGGNIGTYDVTGKMHGLGTPEDLAFFTNQGLV